MRLHHLLFYLLVIFLPTQLGKHFWPDWAMVQGLRIDYLSPTIYLTDILVILILLFWWWEERKKKNEKRKMTKKNLKYLGIVIFIGGFLVVNSLLAASPPVAFYKLIKILEFSLLGFYIVKNQVLISNIQYLISIAIIYSSLLAVFQFLNQGSVGGLLWWLGERTFNSGTPGIAQTVLDGRLVLRPYATFPHPNVLGGFLAVTLPLLILLKPKFRLSPFILGTIALFLTFSRSAWLVFGLSLMAYGAWFLRKNWKQVARQWPRLAVLVILVFIGSIIFTPTLRSLQTFTTIQLESISLRQNLNEAAIKMVSQSPLFGVGLGNFLVKLPEFWEGTGQVRFFQPAHNIYLLITAETGLMGLAIFLWFIFLTFKKLTPSRYSLVAALSAILALGLFDHFFYTLQQGQLLATLVFGLAWSAKIQTGNK